MKGSGSAMGRIGIVAEHGRGMGHSRPAEGGRPRGGIADLGGMAAGSMANRAALPRGGMAEHRSLEEHSDPMMGPGRTTPPVDSAR